jgi:hypothetical protein
MLGDRSMSSRRGALSKCCRLPTSNTGSLRSSTGMRNIGTKSHASGQQGSRRIAAGADDGRGPLLPDVTNGIFGRVQLTTVR